MEIIELRFIKRDLGMAGIVMNLHRLDIGSCDLTVRAFELGVAALVDAGPVDETGLSSAPAGGCSVDLGGYFLGCVLLWLGFSRHDWDFFGFSMCAKSVCLSVCFLWAGDKRKRENPR